MRILPLLLLLVVADLVCAGNRKLVVTQSQEHEVKIDDDGDVSNHHSIPRGEWGSQNPHEVGDHGQDNEGSSGNHN